MNWKTFFLLRSEILGLFRNMFTTDHMYSCHKWEKFPQQVPTLLSQKRKTFSKILLHFSNLHKILPILKTKVSFIASIFWKLLTPTNVVTSILECPCFRTPFQSQSVHGTMPVLKPVLQHFYPNFPLLYNKLSWKTSLFVRSEILGLFGNTLTTNDMYSRHRWEKFPERLQTLLSQQSKKFSGNFIGILQWTQNLAHFEKKDQLHRLNIMDYIGPEKCGYFNAWKLPFQNTLPESNCSRVPDTAESCTTALLSQFSINLEKIEAENISLSQIWNFRTVW